MKIKKTKTVPKQEERSEEISELPQEHTRKKFSLSYWIVFILCIAASFALGHFVGGKLAQYGVRDQVLGWVNNTFKKAPVADAKKTSPNAQALVVDGTTIVSPGNGATQAQQQAFVSAIDKTAKETSAATVSAACSLEPKVIRIKMDSEIVFTNTDSIEHTLKYGASNKTLVIAPNGTAAIVFPKELAGIHGIVCDKENTHVGFLQVTQ